MWRVCALCLTTLLAGCSQTSNLNYQPIALSDATAQDDIVGLQAKFDNAKLGNSEFAYQVIEISNQRCDAFFESLDRLRTDSDFALGRLAAVSTALPTILNQAGVAATAVSNVSAALGFVTGTVNEAKQFYLLAEFKPQLYKKWQVFRVAEQARVVNAVAGAKSISEAKLYLYEYVRLCLPSQLKQWIFEASDQGSATIVSSPNPANPKSKSFSLAPRSGTFGSGTGMPGPIVIGSP
jgi:hypothetical protein